MPSTEERINARERVKSGDRDYTNPFVHLREIVVNETKALAKIGLMIGIMGRAKDRVELGARAKVLKLVMDRFPEIDWGGLVNTSPIPTTPFPQTSQSDKAVPTGDIALVPPPIGFSETCDCQPCIEYRTFRDRTVN